MGKKWPPPDPQLRSVAEARLAGVAPAAAPARSAEELLHELQVHQIELEMQNEALRQTQIALEESRDRYVDLYEFAPVGYLTLSREGLIVEANLTAAALLEKERNKLRKRRFSLLVAPEDRDRFHLLFMSAMQHGMQQSDELALRRNDGSLLHAQVDCLRAVVRQGADAGGTDAFGVRITITDISERKQAAEKAMQALLAMTESIEEKVRARTMQLRALSVELALSEERVRREVAQDLHDDLGQVLAAVKHHLTALPRNERGGKLARPLREIEALIDQANNSVRALAAQLHPPALHSLGLISALDYLAEEMEHSFGLAVHIHGDDAPALLTEPVLNTLYRALRELLVNVARHAQVSDAAIDYQCSDSHIILAVSDRGIGFDYDQAVESTLGRSCFGLLGMRERIEFLGGEMQVSGIPGKGTRITLKMPIQPQLESASENA